MKANVSESKPTFSVDQLLAGDFTAEYEAAKTAMRVQEDIRAEMYDCGIAELLEAQKLDDKRALLLGKKWGEMTPSQIIEESKNWHAHEKQIMGKAMAWANAVLAADSELLTTAREHGVRGLGWISAASSEEILTWERPSWYTPPTIGELLTKLVEPEVEAKEEDDAEAKAKAKAEKAAANKAKREADRLAKAAKQEEENKAVEAEKMTIVSIKAEIETANGGNWIWPALKAKELDWNEALEKIAPEMRTYVLANTPAFLQ